jgi:uncharacterized protein with WD repeat
VLQITTFAQANEYLNVPDEQPAIVPPEYEQQEDLNSWLIDARARDQYVLRWAENTEIFWNDPMGDKLEPCYSKKGWTDTHVAWSPHGRYLACFHRLGIILWGGPSWKKLQKFGHEGVKLLKFSPSEHFIVTWSPLTEHSKAVVVWNVATGAKMREFPGPKDLSAMVWPIFKWSHDDRYLARLGEDCIHVYESSTMKLLKDGAGKHASLKIEGVKEFEWCPTENRMCYWVPELENAPVCLAPAPCPRALPPRPAPAPGPRALPPRPALPPSLCGRAACLLVLLPGRRGRVRACPRALSPCRSARNRAPHDTRPPLSRARPSRPLARAAAQARVTIIELPSRQELRQKNLYNLQECHIHWHPQGDFLGVKVDRHTKTKKTKYTTFELFRVRDRDVAIEVLELEPKETCIIAFAWEPKGVRFALISGEPPQHDVSIYTMETTKGGSKVRLMAKLDRRAVNHLYWSPAGGTVLLAGLGKLGGDLEWYNVNELQTMGADEHFMCTDVEWDPTGRFVTTGVSHNRHQTENGFNLWSSQGKLLAKYLKDKFYSLQWRPRPPSMLDEEQERDVRKHLREASRCAAPLPPPAVAHRQSRAARNARRAAPRHPRAQRSLAPARRPAHRGTSRLCARPGASRLTTSRSSTRPRSRSSRRARRARRPSTSSSSRRTPPGWPPNPSAPPCAAATSLTAMSTSPSPMRSSRQSSRPPR